MTQTGSSTTDDPDFRAAFDAMPTPCVVLAPDLTIVAANNAFVQAAMTRRDALLGRHLFDAFPDNPDDPQADGTRALGASLRQVLDSGRPDTMAVQRYDIRDADGGFHERHWSPVNTPVFDRSGRLTHILHQVHDVTAFVQAQARADRMETELARQTLEVHAANQRLQQVNDALDREIGLRTAQREHLHSLLMAVPMPIALTLEPGHRLALRNVAMSQLLGERQAQVETLADVAGAGSELLAIATEVYRSARPVQRLRQSLDWIAPTHGDGPRYHDVYLHPLLGAGHAVEGLVIAIVEVTAHVQAEARSNAAAEELRHERDLREQFVLALTHDLRTPLSAAMMANRIIVRKLDDETTVRRMGARVASSLERIDQMLRDLLDATKIGAGGRLALEVGPCDLRETVAAVIDELATVHGDRFVLQAEQPIHGQWNCDHLRRMVDNLCVNAVKYGAAQRPVTVRLSIDGNQAVIEVHNEGPAIPPEQQEALFVPFSRGAADGDPAPGWGLGLTLVRGIAEAHGGEVTLHSTREAGTTFRVRLPRDTTN